MKIGLIGYGKMGQLIEKIALQKKHQIVCKGSPRSLFKETPAKTLQEVDVFIDFSHPEYVLDNIKHVSALKKNLIEGTTGWDVQGAEARTLIEKSQIGFLFAPNFSIGMKLFLNMLLKAAQLMDAFPDYDVSVMEQHHNQKVDAPSGSAKAIIKTLIPQIKRKSAVVCNVDRQIAPHELHVASLRCGSIPGTHTVLFDSLADSITITHQARNREGFALGAVTAAEWILGKSGIYSLEDIF